MELINMFYDDIKDAADRRVPFIIPIGTLEYHAHHLTCGTDTVTILGSLRELEKEKEIVICPPMWYGIASYAVCGPRPGHFNVNEDAYAAYLYDVVKSMVYGGVKNIYLIPFHQTESDVLMPMTIACHKVAKRIAMEYMEDTRGKGWWGSDDYSSYYEDLGSEDDPFSYVKVVRLMGPEAQKKAGGVDHAGKWETSFVMATYPELVDMSRCDRNTEWFAASAVEANLEDGKRMLDCTLEWLRKQIV